MPRTTDSSSTPPPHPPTAGGVGAAARSGRQRPRWKRILRRLGVIAGVGMMLLLAVFFLIPVWISNEQGRDYVLQRLNKRLAAPNLYEANARVLVDHWSLGWFRPTEVTNLRILRPDDTVILSCPQVKSGLTLWNLVWGNYDLGNTTVDELHLEVKKYPDGRSSLDLITGAPGAGDLLRTVRGALEIKGGEVSVTSAKTGETIRYTKIHATLSISTPDSPFRLKANATGTSEGAGRPSLTGELSIDATLPPARTLAVAAYWSYLQDIEFTASNVPTGLFLDCLEINPDWAQSLGPALDYVRFVNKSPGETGRPVLMVRGKGTEGTPATFLDARLAANREVIYMPTDMNEDFHVEGALRWSPLLVETLGRMHPLLGEVDAQEAGTRGGLVRMSGSGLLLPLGNPGTSQVSGRLMFPELRFSGKGRETFLGMLLAFMPKAGGGGAMTRPAEEAVVAGGTAMRFRMEGGVISYENFVVDFLQPRAFGVNFAGNVTLGGQLDLLATMPGARGGLSSGTMQVVVQGTVERPVFRRAE